MEGKREVQLVISVRSNEEERGRLFNLSVREERKTVYEKAASESRCENKNLCEKGRNFYLGRERGRGRKGR